MLDSCFSLRRALPILIIVASGASRCLGQSLFQGHQVVNPGGGATLTLVVGHFNADTMPDLAVANSCGVSILLGNGNGNFTYTGVFYGSSPNACPYGLVVGDFNGDGKKDLATANELDNSVSILLGSGVGTFTAQPDLPAGDTPRYIVTADFNGDGKADLAAANQFSDNVSVFLGNGNGTFQPQVTYSVDELPRGIVAGNFNADSHPDLAVATRTGSSLSLLIGNGDGTFQPQISTPLNLGRPSPLLVRDLNADGKSDLVVGADSDYHVSVLLGQGNGSFESEVGYRTTFPGTPYEIAYGNFNGDAAVDIVSAEAFSNLASVLLGVGNGSFAPTLTFPSGFTSPATPTAVATGDFNSDGFDDIALGSDSDSAITILMNQKPFPGSCADVDGDGFGSPGDPSCAAGALTDCNDASSGISPLASDPCDGVDNNCDSIDGYDQDVDTFTTCTGDCNDLVSNVHPGAREYCNGVDEDCNGVIDIPAEEATSLAFDTSGSSLAWSASAGFQVKYNVYRGAHAVGTGFGYNQTCFLSAITTTSATDSQAPPVGQFFHYFVSGENSCGEGGLGLSSSSNPRPNSLPCP
jgi:VCBS repeat protein/putative metal-binding protein/FG-GAP repeat protein